MAADPIRVVPATLAHIDAIDLRDGDRREIEALGLSPREGLRRSLARSLWADAYLVDGAVAALVGVAQQPIVGGIAMPWLLTGRPVDRHRKAFLRLTRARVKEMHAEHGTLVAHVQADYREAVRWLGWLGFTLAPPQPLGPRGALFHQATLKGHAMLTIAQASVAEIANAPAFAELAAEYAAESAINGLPPPTAKMDAYRHLESLGLLHAFGARLDSRLIGFLTVLAPVLPHYGVAVAVSESFFVAAAHRKSGAGLALLKAAEDKARALGSPGLLVSAPVDGRLFEVLPRRGYVETNRVFFKKVTDG